MLQILEFFIFILSVSSFEGRAENEYPVVHTPLGTIKGSFMRTRLNKTIYSFRGLRYAKSPEKERRFKLAEPVHPWDDVFDASEEGPACPNPKIQKNMSEDCLRLNVYTTELPDSKKDVKRPVIVFFHPGAFFLSSSQSFVAGPQYLLDHDIVLVTVNYRLGFLGFASTGDARAPGNLGLKDQVESLRWVQKNIAAFGGDPNSVTISGSSAGSMSVILHMLSPMSKGLFHRGIAISGALPMKKPLPTDQKNFVIKQASFVNCPSSSIDAAFKCLKDVPIQKFVDTAFNFTEWYNNPLLLWSPVVEPEIPGVERFVTAQPDVLIRTKNFTHLPLIIGITEDEFSYKGDLRLEEAILGDDWYFRNLSAQWEHAAPICFEYERNTNRSKYISREIRNFFFNDEPITTRNGAKLGEIYADAIIGFPVYRSAKLLAENSKAPVYYYKFTYQGRYSFAVWKSNKKPIGVAHLDDTQYILYMPGSNFPLLGENDPEIAMLEKLTAMWMHFAKTGEPIPSESEMFKDIVWDKMDAQKDNYLEIGTEIKMKNNIFEDRYALWEKLFPLKPL